VELDLTDQITRDTLVTHEGQIVNNRIRELLGIEPIPETVLTTSASENGDR
jgi:hypothetical protein